MKVDKAVSALAALANESRLELFRLLVKRGLDGYTPNEIAEKLGIPASTLSFHLKELARAGLIRASKQSRFIYYSPDFAAVNVLMDFLTEHCCSLSTSNDASCCVPEKSIKARRKPAIAKSKSRRSS